MTTPLIRTVAPDREIRSPQDLRGKVMGVFASVIGFSLVMGPLVGGFFTDHGTIEALGTTVAGWRLVFYVNLPIGALALFMIIAKMPKLSHKATGRVDVVDAELREARPLVALRACAPEPLPPVVPVARPRLRP